LAALLTFDTTHYALWAEEIAQEQGIPSELVPAPPAAAARCNLALSTLPDDLPRIREALRAAGVPFAVYDLPFEP
jgi:hypothetical protein